MAEFFDKFPKITYDIDGIGPLEVDLPTNIMVRFGFLLESIKNPFLYYEYTLKDNEKPEILAEKLYKDPEAYWVLMMTNNRLDPIYDWPLSYPNFDNYLADKYRSEAEADEGRTLTDYEVVDWTRNQTTEANIKHYFKVIKTKDGATGKENVVKYKTVKSDYDLYPEADLAVEQLTLLPTGKSVYVYEYRDLIRYYDWEFEENERKRQIKILKPSYYVQVKEEFNLLMATARGEINRGLRRVI